MLYLSISHDYKQCQKDCLNSMNHFDKNGMFFFQGFADKIIIFEEKLPRYETFWTGDLEYVELRKRTIVGVSKGLTNQNLLNLEL